MTTQARAATQATVVANQATLQTAYNWIWTSDVTSPNPSTTVSSGPTSHSHFEYGTSTVGALDDAFVSSTAPMAGDISGSYSFSPTSVNVFLDTEAPDQNQRDPGIKDLITDHQGIIGTADSAINMQFIDYITNTSTADVTVQFTFKLYLLQSGGADWSTGFTYYLDDTADRFSANPVTGAFLASGQLPASSTGNGSYTYTIPAGHTVEAGYAFGAGGHALWEWPQASDQPDGWQDVVNATGNYFIDELDSGGNAVANNPDLQFDSGVVFGSPACFASGTQIGVPGGEVAVERLLVGASVSAHFGGVASVVWMGHRRVDCRNHPHPEQVWSVRVRAGTFGRGMPARDVHLSPDHAIFVDGVLIPVRYLINGTNVVQEEIESITYWHVELDQHDVIQAEGLPCESYLDTGDRSNFANADGPSALYPDFAALRWEAQGCAPLVVTGRVLDTARRRVNARGLRSAISRTAA